MTDFCIYACAVISWQDDFFLYTLLNSFSAKKTKPELVRY